jgi:hypothetical protein
VAFAVDEADLDVMMDDRHLYVLGQGEVKRLDLPAR